MRLILSGEGKKDMGHKVPTESGWEFRPGPMARIVDRLLEIHSRVGYSLLDLQSQGTETVRFVDETELAQCTKPGPTKLAGLKYGKGNAFFTRNAQVLGLLAIEDYEKSKQPIMAVLFRDADPTCSSSREEWKNKFNSMLRGFDLAGFNAGVPMVPRPKSEAWLLCGLKYPSNAGCDKLEEASGNDDSPKSLKKQLVAVIGHDPSAEEQTEWITSRRIDPASISMPSFTAFRDALELAINNALNPC